MFQWLGRTLDGFAGTIDHDSPPDLPWGDYDAVRSTLDLTESIRGFQECLAAIEEEFLRFLASPRPPRDAPDTESVAGADALIIASSMEVLGTLRIDIRVSSLETGLISETQAFDGTEFSEVRDAASAYIDQLMNEPRRKVSEGNTFDYRRGDVSEGAEEPEPEPEEEWEDEEEVADDGGLGGSPSKKAVDNPDTPEYKFVAEAAPGEASGIFCDNIKEEIPHYCSAPCERVITKKAFPGNAWIVLGRDRPASRASGYGGAGDTQASSIDIVVGRMGSQARGKDKNNQAIRVDPDFKNDAARIYISQKCDIDNYFGLAGGTLGNFATKSGIGLKADGIRLVAREGIKLVTGGDATNSQGASINGNYGIDLIANNDDGDMQPIPLGSNLAEAIQELADFVGDLAGTVDGILEAQMIFNKELMNHTHRSPFYALDTTPSIPLIPVGTKTLMEHTIKSKKDLFMFKLNLENYKIDYLTKLGESYINSRYNNTN